MDIDPELSKAAPGAVGALIALRFLQGSTWKHTALAFVGGCACAYFGSEYAVKWSGADVSLAGFVLGLFGMALVSKVHESLEQFKPVELVVEWLRKRWL